MRRAQAPRPLPIRLFAALFLAAGMANYLVSLERLGGLGLDLARIAPQVEWSRELLIVVVHARLTMLAIPVALIWFFASNIARWLVTLAAVFAIPGMAVQGFDTVRSDGLEWRWLATNIVYLAAIALLFAPSARRWFARDRLDAKISR